MHSRYKDKHVLNHKLNSSVAVILLPHFKMAPLPPTPQKATLYVCSPVSHSDRSFYSNLMFSRMARATFRIPFFFDRDPLPL